MPFTIMPAPKFTGFDNNGDPLIGGKLYVYTAGTTTLATTYSDANGLVPNSNPVILDAGGRATVFLAPGSYKFVLKTYSDATVWSQDNVSSAPGTATDLDTLGIPGEDMTAGQVVYLSAGLGGKTAGLWYLADYSNPYSSSAANIIAMTVGPVTAGQATTFRTQGTTTVTGPLVTGVRQYVGGMGGLHPETTTLIGINVRLVGVASSPTTIVSLASLGGEFTYLNGDVYINEEGTGGTATPSLNVTSSSNDASPALFLRTGTGGGQRITSLTHHGSGVAGNPNQTVLTMLPTWAFLIEVGGERLRVNSTGIEVTTGTDLTGIKVTAGTTLRPIVDFWNATGNLGRLFFANDGAFTVRRKLGGDLDFLAFTATGAMTVAGLSASHAFTAGGTGTNQLTVTNTTSGAANTAALSTVAGTTSGWLTAYSQGYTTGTYDRLSGISLTTSGAGGLSLVATNAAGAIRFYTGGTAEVGRIENTGQLFLGATVAVISNTRLGVAFSGTGFFGTGLEIFNTDNTNNAGFVIFAANGVRAGEITRVGTTAAVVYTTTSDENLKENFTNFEGALDRVLRIDAGTFTWKSDGQHGSGFKAQQLATVYPDAVVKLAVDKGALTPLLVGAIKELARDVRDLKARL